MDKKEIIFDYDKSQFMRFLECDNEGYILKLLDEEGLALLNKYQYKTERISYILVYSKYRNELFKNDLFLKVFFNTDIISYYANIRLLDFDTSLYLFEKSIEYDKNIADIFSYMKLEYKLNLLDNWKYDYNILYELLRIDESKVVKKIIDNYDVDLSKISIGNFIDRCFSFTLASREKNSSKVAIDIPGRMLTNSVLENIWSYNDIFVIRTIINKAGYITDSNIINDYVKKQEERILSNLSSDTLIEPFNEMFNAFELIDKANTGNSFEEYDLAHSNFHKLLKKINIPEICFDINKAYENNDINEVYKYLKILSDRYISNYMIDYFFEDNYHNVILNMNELLRFYYDGNISLPEDRVGIYYKISNIDSLRIEDKKDLFDELKNINIMEMFYDDMLKARNIVGQSIKNNSISSDTLPRYIDSELSSKYGVDVYTSDDEMFFGIIKTMTSIQNNDRVPTGHSFSLVGNGAVRPFNDGITLLYDASSFNPEQLVHTYPMDSFTFYRPFDISITPTKRVNTLLTADELIDSTLSYNEILILEKGTESTDIDDRIPSLVPIAVYCVDEISEEALEYAKNHGLGIFLAKTKNKESIFPINDYRGKIDYWNYNYYDSSTRDELESKRIK